MARDPAAPGAPEHARAARAFFVLGFLALATGGALAVAMRVHLIGPENGWLSPTRADATFTLHGLVMLFWALPPLILLGPAHLLTPRLVGAARMAFPRACALSVAAHVASLALLIASVLVASGTARAGWTLYPPLSDATHSPGAGTSLVLLALAASAAATLVAAGNLVATVVAHRAPGLTMMSLPLGLWGLFLASVLSLAFLPLLLVAATLLLLDRHAGTAFFSAGGGDPLLFQHLFWIFGHPQVYILILPAWGLIGEMLARFSSKPPHGARHQVAAMIAICAIASLVHGHHMFTTGLVPLAGKAFVVLTLLVAIPSQVLVISWLRTVRGGALKLEPPLVYAVASMLTFVAGGVTGLFLGNPTTDIYLHDTMFVVGHFHLTLAASVLLAAFAGFHAWFPFLAGRDLGRRLGFAHALITGALMPLVFAGHLAVGWAGQARRLANPFALAELEPLRGLTMATSWLALVLAAAQVILVVNVVRSLRARPAPTDPAPDAPARAGALGPDPAA